MLFAIFTALAAFGIGSTVQANAISTLARDVMGVNPWVSGAIITILVGLVLVGGIKSIARVCSALVPFMAVVYVIGCIIILCMQSAYVWPAIKLIVTSAFTEHAVGGGVLGSSIMIAARYGIARGLFSNESGLGSAPIVAASAQTKNPVRQALVSASGTFWDTVVICAITGIVIVSCILSYADVSMIDNAFLRDIFDMTLKEKLQKLDGGALTRLAFGQIPYVGAPLLLFGLFTFAFSTILGWSLYAQRAVEYIGGYKLSKVYVWLFLVAVFLGSAISLNTVWTMADIFNALMAIPNLFALILLSKVLVKDTNYYLWNDRLHETEKE
jgi:AGCS family alanine or glycine:cation symporter